jgi:hypothetical protein
MKSAVDDIYNATEQYAGFSLQGIEGNLMMNGNVAAKQNHSGVCAYLDEGVTFAVSEQMTHLLRRQQNLDKMHIQKEDDQYVRSLRYESTFKEPTYATDDLKAKRTLPYMLLRSYALVPSNDQYFFKVRQMANVQQPFGQPKKQDLIGFKQPIM